MKKGGLKTIVSELQGASKMHLRQSKELEGHIDDMKSPASRNGYNQVNVQDLQDMGAVKKDKKGKQYVVNERLTGTSKDTLNVGNHYSGRKYKTGELIDETDYEDMSEKANKSPMSRRSRDLGANDDGSNSSDVPGLTGPSEVEKGKQTAVSKGKVSGKGREGTNREERKSRRKERRAIRKDKTLSSSQKTMAKKESRQKQKENTKGIKKNSPLNFKGANSSNSSCWDGYRKDGVKESPSGTGETVNNCIKI